MSVLLSVRGEPSVLRRVPWWVRDHDSPLWKRICASGVASVAIGVTSGAPQHARILPPCYGTARMCSNTLVARRDARPGIECHDIAFVQPAERTRGAAAPGRSGRARVCRWPTVPRAGPKRGVGSNGGTPQDAKCLYDNCHTATVTPCRTGPSGLAAGVSPSPAYRGVPVGWREALAQ